MLAVISATWAHITFNPDLGATSGGYFHTTLRVPHGANGLHTTRLVVDVPYGVLVLKPEVPEGWAAEVETRQLAEYERYSSHGALVTEAPLRLTLQAESHGDGVHADHLLNVDLQLKFGCSYSDERTNTVWQRQYATWWRIYQRCTNTHANETTEFSWSATQSDTPDGVSPAWSALPGGERPSPYVFVEPGSRCSAEHLGTPFRGGLVWFGAYVPQEVESSVAAARAPSHDTAEAARPYELLSVAFSVVALVLSVASTTALVVLAVVRYVDRRRFTERLLGIEFGRMTGTRADDP